MTTFMDLPAEIGFVGIMDLLTKKPSHLEKATVI